MEIYVYDFDGTIYRGDSSVDFFLFTFQRHPFSIIRILPSLMVAFLQYFLKKIKKEQLKEIFFSFLKYIPNTMEHVEKFWQQHLRKIKKWYLEKKDHSKDVIISASPEFLLEIPSREMKIYKLIASKVDSHSGHFLSPNCYGKEKVVRLKAECPEAEIKEFYSDTYSDRYLAEEAESAYLIKEDKKINFWGKE